VLAATLDSDLLEGPLIEEQVETLPRAPFSRGVQTLKSLWAAHEPGSPSSLRKLVLGRFIHAILSLRVQYNIIVCISRGTIQGILSRQRSKLSATDGDRCDPGGIVSIEIKTQIAGVVFEILVEQGARVSAGETILVIESMKMEIPVDSTGEGVLAELCVSADDVVAVGQVLARIKE
jgi:acetyl-CoA carboxylase biotin carboxyl carrier protein